MGNHSINVELIIESLGGDVKAAEFFEITRQGVAKWRKENRIPNARLLHLKAARPDLFEASEHRTGIEHAIPLIESRAPVLMTRAAPAVEQSE